MNYDNQRLMYIQARKTIISREMKECFDMHRLIELDKELHELTRDEHQILDSMGVKI